MSTGCSWCGANPYVGCKHQSPIPRPQMLKEPPPPPDEEKTDLRPFNNPGRAFKLAKARKAKAAREAAKRGE
jgi:hypothetical protein